MAGLNVITVPFATIPVLTSAVAFDGFVTVIEQYAGSIVKVPGQVFVKTLLSSVALPLNDQLVSAVAARKKDLASLYQPEEVEEVQ